MDNSSMSMNHALSSHLLDTFEQSRRASMPPFGGHGIGVSDLTRNGYLPSSHGTYTQFSTMDSNFSSADQLAAMQAKLNKKLGPEFISQRPGPGGPKLTYAEGWKIINLANEVFGFNGWSSSVLSITTDYIDLNESTQRYNVGVSALVRVTLRDGAFHEDVGYGALENAKGKGMALDKCKKEAVTDAIKRTLRNFGNVLGNCLYDKQYVSEIVKVKAPILKLDQDTLHRRPDLAGPVPNMSARESSPQASSSGTHNQQANRSTTRPPGNPSPLATSTPVTNRVLPHNLPTPDTSMTNAPNSTSRPQAQTSIPRRLQGQAPQPNPSSITTASRAPTPATGPPTDRVSPPAPTVAAPQSPMQRTASETSLFDAQLAGELTAEGTVYGSDDDAFFDGIVAGELDMDVAEIPPVPAPQPTVSEKKRPAPARVERSRSVAGPSTSAGTAQTTSRAATNADTANPSRPAKIRLADAIRGGAPARASPPEGARDTTSEVGQKRQRIS